MTKTANSKIANVTSKRPTKGNATRTRVSVKKEGEKEEMGQAVADQPKLLSGGNPQIAKGYGDAPVQAYIAAMPGWKNAVGHHLDQLIMRAVPKAQKAVKWNSPLYGMEATDGSLASIALRNTSRSRSSMARPSARRHPSNPRWRMRAISISMRRKRSMRRNSAIG